MLAFAKSCTRLTPELQKFIKQPIKVSLGYLPRFSKVLTNVASYAKSAYDSARSKFKSIFGFGLIGKKKYDFKKINLNKKKYNI